MPTNFNRGAGQLPLLVGGDLAARAQELLPALKGYTRSAHHSPAFSWDAGPSSFSARSQPTLNPPRYSGSSSCSSWPSQASSRPVAKSPPSSWQAHTKAVSRVR